LQLQTSNKNYSNQKLADIQKTIIDLKTVDKNMFEGNKDEING
jgi:hypothetical protein